MIELYFVVAFLVSMVAFGFFVYYGFKFLTHTETRGYYGSYVSRPVTASRALIALTVCVAAWFWPLALPLGVLLLAYRMFNEVRTTE